jgi:hypothetical protein
MATGNIEKFSHDWNIRQSNFFPFCLYDIRKVSFTPFLYHLSRNHSRYNTIYDDISLSSKHNFPTIRSLKSYCFCKTVYLSLVHTQPVHTQDNIKIM